MNILITAMAFLLILAAVSFGHLKQVVSLTWEGQIYRHHDDLLWEETHKVLNEHAYDAFRALVPNENGEKNSKTCTRFLHIQKLFKDPPSGEDNPVPSLKICKDTHALLQSLIVVLYQNTPFYQETLEAYPDAVSELLKKLLTKGQERHKKNLFPFKAKKSLANIDLEDPVLQNFFYHMLKGSSEEMDPGDEVHYPSLLDFLSLESRDAVLNVYLAPPPLLLALFGDQDTVNEVVIARDKYYDDLMKYPSEKKKSEKELMRNEFEQNFVSRIPKTIDPKTCDFNISGTKP